MNFSSAATPIFTVVLGFSALTFAAPVANAMVPVPGAFTATVCGNQEYKQNPTDVVDVQSVCLGGIAEKGFVEGEINQANAVAIRLVNGQQKLFFVRGTADLLVAMQSGNTKTVLHLVSADDSSHATLKAIRSADGQVLSVAGEIDGVQFFVPQLAAMMTIQ